MKLQLVKLFSPEVVENHCEIFRKTAQDIEGDNVVIVQAVLKQRWKFFSREIL